MTNELFEKERREAALVESLKKLATTVENDPWVHGAYILEFPAETAITTIRISFRDSSGADMTITNMTTKPDSEQGRGLGSRAVQQLLIWARENNLGNIRAVQIQQHNEHFWEQNGFAKAEDKNPSNDYIYKPEDKNTSEG